MKNKSSSGSNVNNKLFYGHIILIACFLIILIVWGAQSSFGVFLKPVLTELNWTRSITAGAYSLNLLLFGVWGILMGRLSDRFGPRIVVTVCGVLISLSYLLMSRIEAIWQIYFIFGVLLSFGTAAAWVPLLSTVVRWYSAKRGLAMGIVASGVGLGIIVMPPLTSYLITSYGWRTSYVIIGIITLSVPLIFANFLKRDPFQIGQSAYGTSVALDDGSDPINQGISLKEALSTRQFWAIMIMYLIFGYTLHTIMVHIVAHATDKGIPANVAATILSAIGIVTVLSKIGMGSASDRLGSKRIIMICYTLFTVAFILLTLNTELWLLYLFALVFAAGYGGLSATQPILIAECFGLKSHGTILGICLFAVGIGAATGPLVAGYIFDMTSNYIWAFTCCAILSLLGVALTLFLKPAMKESVHLQ